MQSNTVEAGCALRAMNEAGRSPVLHLSLGAVEEGALGFMAWGIVGAIVASLSSASLSGQPAQQDAWDGYKMRLEYLARQQGVREATIQANIPTLTKNDRVIELERTEPIARTSNGVVGALEPYLRSHVTESLIRRGRENYSENFTGLTRIEQRYGVDPAVLMAIWG